MAERYLLTGCAGFIASKVADLLLAGRPRGGGRRQSQRRLRSAAEALAAGPVAVAEELPLPSTRHHRPRPRWSRCSPPAAEPPFAAVVNLAARAGVRPSVSNPWVYYQANCIGTLNLLDMCRRSGVRKFLLGLDLQPLRQAQPRCPTARTPTRTGRCRPMRPRRRRPRRWPSPTTTCTAWTSRFPATSRFTVRRAGPT